MASEIVAGPRLPDVLPAYTARISDVETTSIRSAAPSYTSAAPSYHSNPGGHSSLLGPSSQNDPRRARPARAARGDGDNSWRAARPRLGEANISPYTIPWSSVRSSHQERLYHSVAHRRAKAAAKAAAECCSAGREPVRIQPPAICIEDILEEDPYVVGGEAAERARKERLRKEKADEALRQEDKSWDFMLRQMADWEARERSWATFRREAEKPGLFKRKLGVFGLGRW